MQTICTVAKLSRQLLHLDGVCNECSIAWSFFSSRRQKPFRRCSHFVSRSSCVVHGVTQYRILCLLQPIMFPQYQNPADSWPELGADTKYSPTPRATRIQRLHNQRFCHDAEPKRGILAESFYGWKNQSASRIAHAQRVRQTMLERYRAEESYARNELWFLSQHG